MSVTEFCIQILDTTDNSRIRNLYEANAYRSKNGSSGWLDHIEIQLPFLVGTTQRHKERSLYLSGGTGSCAGFQLIVNLCYESLGKGCFKEYARRWTW